MSKRSMDKLGKSFDKFGKSIKRGVDDATHAVSKVAHQATADVAAGVREDTAKSEQLAKDTVNKIRNMTVSAAGQAKVLAIRDAMATAKVTPAALDDLEAGSKLAVWGLEKGVEAVKDEGVLIAKWAEENYCQIGVSIDLGTIFAALLYAPDPESIASETTLTAPLSAEAALYLSLKEGAESTLEDAGLRSACDVTAESFVDLIWAAPDVSKAIGSKNKEILTTAIAFTLENSVEVSAGAMVFPPSCAALVAGIVTTLVAQLACEHSVPKGAREWGEAGASSVSEAPK